MFYEIEQSIDELIETIGKIRQNRETNASTVKEQKILIENEIRELRTKIEKHLDKLQESLMKELTETEKGITVETLKLLVALDEKQKELTEHQTNIVNIKMYASDLQAYLAVKQIDKDVETQDTCIQSIINSNSLNQNKLSYMIDNGLKTITTSIQKLGEVVVESMPCELTFVRKKDKQVQMMVADLSPPMSVYNIQLKLKQKISIKGNLIKGCSLLPDGRIVLSCIDTNTVSFINKEGIELFQIGKDKTGSRTCDTVYVKYNNCVAVSSGPGSNGCIAMIDIESQKVMRTISMDTGVYGMAVTDRTLYYCTETKGLKMLHLTNNYVRHIISRKRFNVHYVAIYDNQLYYTGYYAHTVICCSLLGTTQWIFKNYRVLCGPLGISVDNDGNVYVVGFDSNNVVVISPDGKLCRQVLSSEDGLRNPRVLDYDKSTNRLLVVNENKSAFLFDVTSGH
jgi:DNA-binding beta-propeller fold protein YncE